MSLLCSAYLCSLFTPMSPIHSPLYLYLSSPPHQTNFLVGALFGTELKKRLDFLELINIVSLVIYFVKKSMTEKKEAPLLEVNSEVQDTINMANIMEEIGKTVDELAIKAVITKDQIHITVSKEMNERILNFITSRTKDKYWITLNSLYWCQYHVSPFINPTTNEGTDANNIGVVIGLFNYAQMLWQWNTFTDNWRKYDLNDLLNNYKIILI